MFINMETFLGLLRQSCAKPGGTLDFDNVASKIQNSSDFGKQLVQMRDLSQRNSRPGYTATETIRMRLPRQNCVYTGGLKHRIPQNVYAEYTERRKKIPLYGLAGKRTAGHLTLRVISMTSTRGMPRTRKCRRYMDIW